MSDESNAHVGGIALLLARAGGAILIAISALVTTSVVLRFITGEGINGDFEIVQLVAAVAAFCMFPHCFWIRGNIIVDTFTTRLPTRIADVLDGVWNALFGLIAIILCWRMVIGAMDQFTNKTTLQVLPVPTWWAVGLCAVLMAVLAATVLVVGLRLLARKS